MEVYNIENIHTMGKLLSVLAMVLLFSCADTKNITVPVKNVETGVIEQRTFEFNYYGPLDDDEWRNDAIHYSVCGQNIFWDIVLCETIVVPIWLIGWQAKEPEGLKPGITFITPQSDGSIKGALREIN